MRIIADRKDYYDCVQAHGQDQTLLYVRTPEEVELKQREWPFPSLYNNWWFSRVEVSQHIIGFCGKMCPALEMHGYVRNASISKVCFTIEEVDAFVEKHADQGQKDSYYGKNGHRWWRGYGKRRSEFIQFFEHCEKKRESFTEMFVEKRCPVFVATTSSRKSKIVYNSMLRPYDFVRIFDPYTAYQEISMFMSNMAMPEKEMPVVPDELKIQKRGFDKWSFRRPPAG